MAPPSLAHRKLQEEVWGCYQEPWCLFQLGVSLWTPVKRGERGRGGYKDLEEGWRKALRYEFRDIWVLAPRTADT